MKPLLTLEEMLDDNHFLIQFENNVHFFLIQSYPFMVFKVDSLTAGDLMNKSSDIHEILPDLKNEQNLFTTPGIFYQPILIITNRCNLQCKYCYADNGSYGFDGYSDMDFNTIEQSVKYVEENILKYKEKLAGQDIELAYVAFGGESLINLDGVNNLLLCAKESCERMSVILKANVKPLVIINTNGLLLTDDMLNAFSEYKEYIEFVVSIDGLYHDENRLDNVGHGSLRKTINGINLLKKWDFDFYVTCCLMPDHLNQTAENIKYIRSVIGDGKQINLSFIRGAIENVKEHVAYPGMIQQSYTKENVEQYICDVVSLIEADENIYSNKFMRRVYAGGFRNKCAACLYEFCVTADGSVYPCHNFIQNDYKLGNINDSDFSISSSPHFDKFLSRDMDRLEPCNTCCLKSVCISSFDCTAHSEHDLRDFFKVDELICNAGKQIQLALLKKMLIGKEN